MKKQQGFTLVELMVAAAVMIILSMIAIPNYQNYIRRATCEDAKATLVGASNVVERFRAQNNTYASASLGNYTKSPVDGTAQFNIALVAASSTATTYLLSATPVAGTRLAGTGTLTLSSTGARGATGKLSQIGAWTSCQGI